MSMANSAALRRRLLRVRLFLRPPRRLRMRRPGAVLVAGTFVLGLATLNTGNNLLYLLLGSLLGTIALSGWLSEQALRGLQVRRSLPRAVRAGSHVRIEYLLHNRKPRWPGHGVRVRELHAPLDSASPHAATAGRPDFGSAFVPVLEAGGQCRVHADVTADRRGVFPLHGLTLSTGFPFGLFDKERDIALPGALIVWPRADRAVQPPRVSGRRGVRRLSGAGAATGGERGDYQGLREYRAGDDPRDLHWRSTARRGEPIIRQYERDATEEYWIVLDTVAPTAALSEEAVEVAASLLSVAAARGDRAGLVAGSARLPPLDGGPRLEAAFDVLAAVEMRRHGPAPHPPADPGSCVLVTARGGGGNWGDVYPVGAQEPR
jgi:uncharacterized protein (DUF58 family)